MYKVSNKTQEQPMHSHSSKINLFSSSSLLHPKFHNKSRFYWSFGFFPTLLSNTHRNIKVFSHIQFFFILLHFSLHHIQPWNKLHWIFFRQFFAVSHHKENAHMFIHAMNSQLYILLQITILRFWVTCDTFLLFHRKFNAYKHSFLPVTFALQNK